MMRTALTGLAVATVLTCATATGAFADDGVMPISADDSSAVPVAEIEPRNAVADPSGSPVPISADDSSAVPVAEVEPISAVVEDESGSSLPWIIGGVAVVGAAAAGTVIVVRRKN